MIYSAVGILLHNVRIRYRIKWTLFIAESADETKQKAQVKGRAEEILTCLLINVGVSADNQVGENGANGRGKGKYKEVHLDSISRQTLVNQEGHKAKRRWRLKADWAD